MRKHRWVVIGVLVAFCGVLVPAAAHADGNNTCKFDMFPSAPGGQSELTTGCFLTSATGAAGNKYVVEDFPQAVWHSGAARKVTATSATASGSAVITSTSGHFGAADINNQVFGTGIAGNAFIISVSGSTATLSATTTGVPLNTVLLVQSNDARTFTDATFSGTTMTSATGHFCKPALGNCGTKTDIGKTVSGTRVPNGATISAVTNATTATLSAASIACPAGVAAANCQQVSLGFSQTSPPATARQLRDVTVSGGNTLCSASAGFQASDVNLPVLTTAGANPPGGAHWITSVGSGAPCIAGQTKAVTNIGSLTNAPNQSFVIGQPASDAPANGATVGQLNSELSVNPSLAPGLPACNASNLTASALAATWNNPGSFGSALGQPSGVTTPGAIIAQILYQTGAGNPAFGGYVVNVKASTAGESDTAAHFDIYLPQLLTGVAVCPNTAGVASTFRWNASSATSQVAGALGSVRSIINYTSGSHPGTAFEHIYQGATLKLNTSGACTISFPPTNGFGCGGN
jgi:hypothetical protein